MVMKIIFWHEWKYWLIGIGLHNNHFVNCKWNGSIYIGPFRFMLQIGKKGE